MLTKIFLTEIERTLITASGVTAAADTPNASRSRLGGISCLHRFGSALNHHVHLRALSDRRRLDAGGRRGRRPTGQAADGAGGDAPPLLLPARSITPADLAALGVWLFFSQEKVPDPFWATKRRIDKLPAICRWPGYPHLVAWLVARTSPKTADTYTVPVSSGLIAGKSLMGVATILTLEIMKAGGLWAG